MDKQAKRIAELEELLVELLNALTLLRSQTGNHGWSIIGEAEAKAQKKGFGPIMKSTSKWSAPAK